MANEREFRIRVSRTIYEDTVVAVKADSLDAAREKAEFEAMAGEGHDWECGSCKYRSDEEEAS